jgi:CHAD domain-containing protein
MKPIMEKDLDTEVLHDFRVSIRRTRSALVLMKSVFAQIVTDRFKKDFAFVGKLIEPVARFRCLFA